MGQSTEQLERDLAAERHDLGRNLHELENKAKALKDWRTHYRNHPLAMMSVAFAGAMMLGLLTRGRAPLRSTYADHESDAEPRKRDTDFRPARNVAASVDRVRRHATDTWDDIVNALLGVVAARTVDFVGEKIPGFIDEYSRRHPDYGDELFSRNG